MLDTAAFLHLICVTGDSGVRHHKPTLGPLGKKGNVVKGNEKLSENQEQGLAATRQ